MKFIRKFIRKKGITPNSKKVVSSKPFYFALAVCLIGAGIAAWISIDYSIDPLNNTGVLSETNSSSLSQSSSNSAGITGDNDTNVPFFSLPNIDNSQTSTSSSVESQQSKPSESSDSGNIDSSDAQSTDTSSVAATNTTPAVNSDEPPLFVMPIQGEIFNEFSNGELVKSLTMGDWRTHNGIDIEAEVADPVKSSAEGVVKSIEQDPMWGTVIEIEHTGGYTTIYCGLNESVHVTVGQQVELHEIIGSIGDSALEEILEPVHLHFGMKKNGEWINPLDMIKQL